MQLSFDIVVGVGLVFGLTQNSSELLEPKKCGFNHIWGFTAQENHPARQAMRKLHAVQEVSSIQGHCKFE
jgi:hypothetical protein